MDAQTCIKKLGYVGILTFATVDKHGHPQARSISAIHYEPDAIYFYTARGKNRVWAESFTDGSWDKWAKDDWSFEKLKPIADHYFHAGINATILHVMISQPDDENKPAVRPWFGTYFDRRSQHAADLKPLVAYLRRCNFMLQLGRPYHDVTDQRIMDDGTIIRFTDDSMFEVSFPDGHKETWNPCE